MGSWKFDFDFGSYRGRNKTGCRRCNCPRRSKHSGNFDDAGADFVNETASGGHVDRINFIDDVAFGAVNSPGRQKLTVDSRRRSGTEPTYGPFVLVGGGLDEFGNRPFQRTAEELYCDEHAFREGG